MLRGIHKRTIIFFLFLSLSFHGLLFLLPIYKNPSSKHASEIGVFLYKHFPSKKTTKAKKVENKFFKEEKEVLKGQNDLVDENSMGLHNEIGGDLSEEVGIPDELLRKIERNKFYPEQALREMIEGDVLLSFEVSEKGDVRELRVEKSSGSIYLDRAALDCVKRSQPLPPVPKRVEVLLRYRIRK